MNNRSLHLARNTIAVFTLLLGGTCAQAGIDGIWWEPSSPGTGWNCSAQNDTLFCLVYSYEDDGQPTFRSIIAELSYDINPSSSDVTMIALGDVYRTTDFDQTIRVGSFAGTYELGVFTVDAAGFQQVLIPFNFAFPNDIDSITGVYLASAMHYDGMTGISQLYVFDDETKSTAEGVIYKDVIGPGVPDGRLIHVPEIPAYALFRTTDPAATETQAFFILQQPVLFTGLIGSDDAQRRAGFQCMLDLPADDLITAPEMCQEGTTSDFVLVGIANSPGEQAVLNRYVGPLSPQRAAPLDTEAQNRVLNRLANAAPRIISRLLHDRNGIATGAGDR